MWTCRPCGAWNEDAATSCACGHDATTCETCGGPATAGRCEACRRAIDERPSGRLTRVWTCASPTEAELLRIELRRAGIESILENEGGAAYAIGLSTPLVPLTLVVAEDDAPRALEVLRAERDRAPAEVYIPPVAMIRFPCGCGKELEVPPDFKGLEMDCPFCGRALRAANS
jgi:hypothetical protein